MDGFVFRLTGTPARNASTTLQLEEGPLEEAAVLFSDYKIREDKNGPAIIPAILEDCPAVCRGTNSKCGGNHAHRLKGNVRAMTALGLDCDHMNATTYVAVIEAVKASGHHAFIWETYSCAGPDNYRCRVIFPFAAPLRINSPADWTERIWPTIVRSLGPAISGLKSVGECKDPARLYFLPSKRSADLEREAVEIPGALWDVSALASTAATIERPKVAPSVEYDETRPVDLGKIRASLGKVETHNRDLCQALLLGKSLVPPPSQRLPGQPTRYEAWRSVTAVVSNQLEGWESPKAIAELLRPSYAAMKAESPEDYTSWETIDLLLETARATLSAFRAERAAARERSTQALRGGLTYKTAEPTPQDVAPVDPIAAGDLPALPPPPPAAPSSAPPPPPPAAPPLEQQIGSVALTDLGNAERLWDRYGAHNRFVPDFERWYSWDDRRWTMKGKTTIAACHHETTRYLADQAQQIEDPDTKAMWIKHATRGESASSTKACITQAREMAQFILTPEQFDADPFLLNVENGTLDLRTGDLLKHDAARLITKIAPVEHDANATAPRFAKFLEEVLPDADTRAFVQRIMGYCLTGSVREQALFFAYGTGQNGKSTLLKLIQRVMGDYQQTGAPGMLVDSNTERHPTEEARLQGKRFVTNSETEQNSHFSEAKIKRLTGGDPMSARFMGKDFFDFEPSHKFFLSGNKKPRISGTDDGIWRRINIIPFSVKIAEKDDKLDDKLWAERAGVLNWLVEGCLAWQATGLHPSAEVLEANEEYRKDEDTMAEFLEERCERGPGFTVRLADIYLAHCQWLEPSRTKPWQRKSLTHALKQRGFSFRRVTAGMVFEGLKLRTAGSVGYTAATRGAG